MSGKIKFAPKFILTSVILTLVIPKSLQAESLPQEVWQALIKGDWAKVLKVLEKSSIKEADVPCRIAATHIRFVTNLNNASLLLFLSAKESNDPWLWLEWMESF